MKFILFSITLFFLLNACQGRGMPFHPSTPKVLFKKKPTLHKHTDDKPLNKKDFPTLKIKGKSSIKKKPLLSKIPIINTFYKSINSPLNQIPIVRDVIPKGSKVSQKHIKNQIYIKNVESFSGGSPVNGLDIGMVRLGQSNTYTRLIFDSYYWEGYAQIPIKTAKDSGTYIFTYYPNHNQIIGILDGYQAFSALVGDHNDLYEGNKMVDSIHLDEYLDKSGFKFTIKLKQKAKIHIYELHNPARIIIDLIPIVEG